MFENVLSVQIIDKPDRPELAGWEDRDMMVVKCIAVHEGLNYNGAIIERDDLERASQTLVGKPVKIRFVNNNPTGHGYDPKTNSFDELVRYIGAIQWVYTDEIEINGETKLGVIAYLGLWQDQFPEICSRLRQLHAEGNLNFSIEADRDYEETPEGYRRCFNILFKALAVVKTPAFEGATSLMVAELLNKGGNQMEEMLKQILVAVQGNTEIAETLKPIMADLQLKVTTLEGENTRLAGELASAQESNLTLQGDLKTVTTQRDEFKVVVETAEKLKVGETRLVTIKKYDAETTETAESLGAMEQAEWVNLLEEKVTNFKPQENAGVEDGIMGVPRDKAGKETINRKDALLNVVTGLLK